MKLPGCCTCCDLAVFEFRGGRPTQPLPIATRVTLALSNGSTMDLTCCATCSNLEPEYLAPRLMALAANAFREYADVSEGSRRQTYLKSAEDMKTLGAEIKMVVPWSELLVDGEVFGVLG